MTPTYLIISSIIVVFTFALLVQESKKNYEKGFDKGQYIFYLMGDIQHPVPQDTLLVVQTRSEVFIGEYRSKEGKWVCSRGLPIDGQIIKWKPVLQF